MINIIPMKIKFLALLSFAILIAGCDGNDYTDHDGGIWQPDFGNKPDDPENDPENDPGNNSGVDMQDAVDAYVSESSTYKDYHYYITIKTKLSEKFPDKDFIYGIEMGYSTYTYYVYASGYGDTYKVEQCIFINGEGSPYLMNVFHMKSYLSLLETMKERELTANEKSLYNDIVKILRDDEREALSTFIYRVFVEVDGCKYYVY